MQFRKTLLGSACVAALACIGLPATGRADTVKVTYSDLGTTAATSSTDLLENLSPVYENPLDIPGSNWTRDGTQGTSTLTDGVPQAVNRDDKATVGDSGGGLSLIYNLATKDDLSKFDFYFGWGDAGRNAAVPVSIYTNSSVTSDPSAAGWKLLTTTNSFYPGGEQTNQFSGNSDLAGVSVLGNSDGTIASGVQSVEFVFGTGSFGQYNGLGEIDVFGAQAPEPASLSLMMMAVLPLLGRRRRAAQ